MSPRPISATGVAQDAGVPLHRQLFLVLHDEIARGALTEGESLPSEQSLGAQFGVSRITVRRALADLAERGLIERRRGVGSFVRPRGSHGPPTIERSYVDELRRIQFETDVDVLEYDTRPPPEAISRRLRSAEPKLHVVRLRCERRTTEPLMITEAWLPLSLADAVSESALTTTALYALLSAAGVVMNRMEHEISAEIAGPATAQRLEIPIGSAVIRIDRVAYVDGSPHHCLSILLSPSRSRVFMSQTSDHMQAHDGVTIAHDVDRVT